jgi:hypothetical protein
MTYENTENQKLAQIQRDLIIPAQENKENTDIIIKIRNGVIVWAEATSSEKIRVEFEIECNTNTTS